MIINEDYKLVSVEELRPHPQNPRVNELGTIRDSIDANGFYGALVVNKPTGHILAGNHRYKAAVEQDIKVLPVIFVDVDEATALRIMSADNRTSDIGGYDEEKLVSLLDQIKAETSLVGSGYSDFDFQEMMRAIEARDPLPPEDFESFNEVSTSNQCPKCGYEF